MNEFYNFLDPFNEVFTTLNINMRVIYQIGREEL